MILTTTEGRTDLPRCFAPVFGQASRHRKGRLQPVLPDGRRFRADGARPGQVAEVHVHDPDVFARLVREADRGSTDAWLEGGWSTPDLQAFMDVLDDGADDLDDGFAGAFLVRACERLRFRLRSNSKRQARRNFAHHYDLGNDFHALWLDGTMTYSSALSDAGQQSLEAAQRRKHESLVDRMGVRPGDHVLEIGCGWGGFAEYTAGERGLRVTGLTISREQLAFAEARIGAAGLSDRLTLKLQDDLDETGLCDGIGSIEMFEAVGERSWPACFDTLWRCLTPGRSGALRIITVPDRRWAVYRSGVGFIQRHLFPGGMLPSPSRLRAEVERAGLRILGSLEFGESCSRTLRLWRQGFDARWAEAARLGLDGRLRRMWDMDITSCAAAFHTGSRDLTQITVERPA